jgi:hypothetical protein
LTLTFILRDLAVVCKVSLVAHDNDGHVRGSLGFLHFAPQVGQDVKTLA